MAKCITCNKDSSDTNLFCTQCGTKLRFVVQNHARLCVVQGEPEGACFLLRSGRTTIGHDCGNIIVLGDEQISKKHAAIVYADNRFWIEDRNSKNGVFVNGEKIGGAQSLEDGAIVKLGSTFLKFEQITNVEQ